MTGTAVLVFVLSVLLILDIVGLVAFFGLLGSALLRQRSGFHEDNDP